MFHTRHPARESRSVRSVNVSSRRRAGHGTVESNGTCYMEKVPRECEIRRVRSGEGGEKRDREKERNGRVAGVVFAVQVLSMGENSDDDDDAKVTSARRMALRV